MMQGRTAWIRGNSIGGSFLASFDAEQPTSLDIEYADLGTALPVVSPDDVFLVENEAESGVSRIYRLDRPSKTLVAEVDSGPLGAPVWAGGAIWLRQSSRDALLRLSPEGHQQSFALDVDPVRIMSAGDRLALLVPTLEDDALFTLLEQPLPE
jgi:hypothetical protein